MRVVRALFESRGSIGEQIHGAREAVGTVAGAVVVAVSEAALVVRCQIVAHVGRIVGERVRRRDIGRSKV